MEETIKIQEEFENLIKELERLKKINEITSANSENAKLVIQEVSGLVNNINSFRKAVEKDIVAKNEGVERLLLGLDKAIIAIESETKEAAVASTTSIEEFKVSLSSNFSDQLKIVRNSISEFKEAISKENGVRLNEIQKEVDIIFGKVVSSNQKIEGILIEHKQFITQRINENKDTILTESRSSFSEIKREVTAVKVYDYYYKELVENFNDEVASFIVVQNDFNTLISKTNEKTQEQIMSKIEELNVKLADVHSGNLDLKKGIKSNKIIVLAGFLILIALVALFYFKPGGK